MAENRSRFIKTVIFGGYERTDVDKRLEALYAQVYDQKNELRVTKLMLEKLKKGTDEEKAHESVLAAERAKITEMQVKCETMSDKVKRADEDSKLKEAEIASLREENEKLKAALEAAKDQLNVLNAGGEAAALGAVFIEAQKSRDMLINTAQEQADKMKADSEKLAENIVADADNKASMIIYEAEKRSAEIAANALAKSEQMKVASQNLKAAMLQDVVSIGSQMHALKQAMDSFESDGMRIINESEQLLKDTEANLKKGGVPVFTIPSDIKPEYFEPPKLKPVDFSAGNTDAEEAKKRSEELNKLQAMAAALDGKGGTAGKAADTKKGSGINLADLAKQAESLNDSKK